MFVLFTDTVCSFGLFIRLVSKPPIKLPELRGIAIQKASYLPVDPIGSPDLISVSYEPEISSLNHLKALISTTKAYRS